LNETLTLEPSLNGGVRLLLLTIPHDTVLFQAVDECLLLCIDVFVP